MTAPNLDPKALARLAIWARLCCAPICRPPGKWTDFNANDWARLLELASAVDRKTPLRFLGISVLLIGGGAVIGAALVIALILLSIPLSPSSTHMACVTAVVGGVAVIAVPLIYRVAADAAARRGLTVALTAEPADAELVAKMRRQNRWIIGLLSAAVVLVMFTMGVFSASLRPFFDQ